MKTYDLQIKLGKGKWQTYYVKGKDIVSAYTKFRSKYPKLASKVDWISLVDKPHMRTMPIYVK